jgi:hypothetical protein
MLDQIDAKKPTLENVPQEWTEPTVRRANLEPAIAGHIGMDAGVYRSDFDRAAIRHDAVPAVIGRFGGCDLISGEA